jgi:hypothetical protein
MVLEDLPEVWTTKDLWVSRIDLIDRRVHGRSTPPDPGEGTPQDVGDDRDQPARQYLLDHGVEVPEHRGLRHTPVQRGVRPVVQGDILPRVFPGWGAAGPREPWLCLVSLRVRFSHAVSKYYRTTRGSSPAIGQKRGDATEGMQKNYYQSS